MMRSTTISRPSWIVVRAGSKVCFWLQVWVWHCWSDVVGCCNRYEFERVTVLSCTSLHSADLVKTKVWLLRVVRIVRSRLWRGRKPIIISVRRAPTYIAVVRIGWWTPACVFSRGRGWVWQVTWASIGTFSYMSKGKKIGLGSVIGILQRCFKVQKFFMQLIKRDWSISSLYCSSQLFVFNTKSLKNSF